ncbi:hypothetical protein V5799_018958 [Amblyomma americanum]|uniref:Uncharacterized protein n=1 Tax=Amblyomma americanum TaxID=6943 RepID=A0AAQ4EY88_AMBAM
MMAPKDELAELATARCDGVDNSQQQFMMGLTRLAYKDGNDIIPVPIEAQRVTSKKNAVRGVIRIDPQDDNETIFQWLRCEQAEIIKVQKMGKTDKPFITFIAVSLPKVVKYYMEIRRVEEYRGKRMVCYNCHNIAYMAKYCPEDSVCKDCGRSHTPKEECDDEPFCVSCKTSRHFAVSRASPAECRQRLLRRLQLLQRRLRPERHRKKQAVGGLT